MKKSTDTNINFGPFVPITCTSIFRCSLKFDCIKDDCWSLLTLLVDRWLIRWYCGSNPAIVITNFNEYSKAIFPVTLVLHHGPAFPAENTIQLTIADNWGTFIYLAWIWVFETKHVRCNRPGVSISTGSWVTDSSLQCLCVG